LAVCVITLTTLEIITNFHKNYYKYCAEKDVGNFKLDFSLTVHHQLGKVIQMN